MFYLFHESHADIACRIHSRDRIQHNQIIPCLKCSFFFFFFFLSFVVSTNCLVPNFHLTLLVKLQFLLLLSGH